MNILILPRAFKFFGSNSTMCICYQRKKMNFMLLREGMNKETKLTKTGIGSILTNKMKTDFVDKF